MPAPEGGVDDEDGWLRSDVWYAHCNAIKMFAHPYVRALRCASNLLQRLLAADVCAPQLLAELFLSPLRLKRPSALNASIPLHASG